MLSRLTAGLLLAAASLAAQTYDFSGAAKTIPFRVLSAEPGVCSPGEAYYNLTTTHLRYCGILNTWTDMAANSGAVTSSTLTSSYLPKATGASALANSALLEDGTTLQVVSRLFGVGALAAPPVAQFQSEASIDATNSNTASNFLAYLHYPASTNNAEAGLAFGVSATASVGAAITLQRLGTGSYGNLHFYTLNVGQTYAKRMTLSAAGGLSIGTTTDAGSGNLLANGTAISSGYNYIATEGGAANAITGTLTGSNLTAGLQVNILLAHTLQAGANTFALNGGGAVAIKSHRNTANNIGTAYAVGGILSLIYDGTQWQDVSQ